jgi:iron complex transport system ATP-binding protein
VTVFEAESVRFRYPGAREPALDGVHLCVARGTLYAVLGPNGSGKSTLLRLVLGVLRPDAGVVRIEGRPIEAWGRRELALRIGVVAQSEELVFPVTVHEMVGMGRYPHLGPFRRAGRADHEAVERAMARCDVTGFAARLVSTLSGGERQRVRVARALAQEPDALVLDEPTAALDMAHEMAVFELLAGLCAEGATIVVVTHNINLAARYADRLLLLDGGRVAAEGRPADVLTRKTIERVYGWPVQVVPHPGPGVDAGAPQVVAVRAPR